MSVSGSQQAYAELMRLLKEIAHITSANNTLEWDMETYMPPAASDQRAETIAYLSGLAHDKYVSAEVEDVLCRLVESSDLTNLQQAVVRKEHRQFLREKRLPSAFVKELSELTAKSHHVWVKAKDGNDFASFAPNLTRIVELQREKARLIGYAGSPYDALLEEYDPGVSAADAEALLTPLREFLQGFIARIKDAPHQPDPMLAKIALPVAQQKLLCRHVATAIGFDLSRGRLDEAAHPFTARLHPDDVPLTTNYNADDCLDALGSTIHEAGHGMIEQALDPTLFGAAAGEVPSLGLHESQSRLWENFVGKSLPFVRYLHPLLSVSGATGLPSARELYRAMNVVRPSFIRIEADEVTYNLHICLRFEIEKALIEGKLDVKDLPEVWNTKFREYFGIEVPYDSKGVLQDVHWSCGLFGYFTSYTLGNLFAAQLFDAASHSIIGLEEEFATGEFAPLLTWLSTRFYRHLPELDAQELVTAATGRVPDPLYFTTYMEKKFGDIYGI